MAFYQRIASVAAAALVVSLAVLPVAAQAAQIVCA
jgi:hypothetical protein